jgi:hypothetical protein
MKFVAPESIIGAFVIAQVTLFLLLIPRLWQRAIAVSYWQQRMLTPVVAMRPAEAAPVEVPLVPVASTPDAVPVVSGSPSTSEEPH